MSPLLLALLIFLVESNFCSTAGKEDGWNTEEKKTKRCCQSFKNRFTCKICRWGSPKFWQMIQNDIPLLMAIPVAYAFDLIDPITAIVALCMTLIDLISMLTYLNHHDERSTDAIEVYELVKQRKEDNWDKRQKRKIIKDSNKNMTAHTVVRTRCTYTVVND